MNKEQALKDFFKCLKVSLKNASLYFDKHPIFIKSVEEAKEKIDILFNFLSPVKVNFTPTSLMIEGEYLEEDKTSAEIAEIFHLRKVKSIEMEKGLTIEELVAFLTRVHLPPREILRGGGLGRILEKENISHISFEELDYSQLLKGEGEEVKDVWIHLFKDALETEDYQKIGEFADNFANIIGKFEIKDFLKDEELQENMIKFFDYLKSTEKDKFRKCLKDLLKSIVRNQNILTEGDIERLKRFFSGADEDDIAYPLMEEIVTDRKFDSLSFNVFSHLLDRDKHEGVAISMANIFRKEDSLIKKPEIKEKIRELLLGTSTAVSKIYQKTLSTFLKEMVFEEELDLDRELLCKNFRFMLLNIFDSVKKKERLIPVIDKISGEIEGIFNEGDFEYLKILIDLLERKKSELSSEPGLDGLEKKISHFVENALFNEEVPPDIEHFLDILKESYSGFEIYLDKMFNENIVNPHILRLFFKFFPRQFAFFKKNLKEKSSDVAFLNRIMENLKTVDSSLTLDSLKYIYSFGTYSMRINALKTMQQLSQIDENFLFLVMKEGDIHLKEEALVILKKEMNSAQRAAEMLLSVPSPFGIRNKILRQNIRIMEEAGFEEARDHLLRLSKKKFFWNRKLRTEALRALSKLNVR